MTNSDAPGPRPAASAWAFTSRQVLRFIIYLCSAPAVLFLAAGRLNWGMGWVYVALALGGSLLSRALVARTHPDLLLERAQAAERQGVKAWDRILVPLAALVGPLATLFVVGLDDRFRWTGSVPRGVVVLGIVMLAAGYAWSAWAMTCNRFFSAHVRIQADRGHTVVSHGPYRMMRHPGYAGGVLADLSVPLMLSSLWGLVPALLTVAVLVVRTALEDRTLQDELPGYREYAGSVRYRLLPGIW